MRHGGTTIAREGDWEVVRYRKAPGIFASGRQPERRYWYEVRPRFGRKPNGHQSACMGSSVEELCIRRMKQLASDQEDLVVETIERPAAATSAATPLRTAPRPETEQARHWAPIGLPH